MTAAELWGGVMMFFADSTYCINGLRKKKLVRRGGRETCNLCTKTFYSLDNFFSVLIQYKVKASQKILQKTKGLKEAHWGAREGLRAGPAAWDRGGAACSESQCRILSLILPRSWGAAQWVGSSLLCSESLSAFCCGILVRSWETFPDLSRISINMFSQRFCCCWAYVLQCRCFAGRFPASSK